MNTPAMQVCGSLIVGAVAGQALAVFGGGAPTIIAPGPIPLVIPAFMGIPMVVLPILPAVAFLLWDPAALRINFTPRRFPMPSWALLGVILALSVAWYVAGWKYGLEYESTQFVYVCASLSILMAIVSIVFASLAHRSNCNLYRWLAHLSLFVWATSYAFPYLGETP